MTNPYIPELYRIPTTDGICLTKDPEPDWARLLRLELITTGIARDLEFKSARRSVLIDSACGLILLVLYILFDFLASPIGLICVGVFLGFILHDLIQLYVSYKLRKIYHEHQSEVMEIIREGKLKKIKVEEDGI